MLLFVLLLADFIASFYLIEQDRKGVILGLLKLSVNTVVSPLIFRSSFWEVVKCNNVSFVRHVSLGAPALHTTSARSTLKGTVGLKLGIKVHCHQQ